MILNTQVLRVYNGGMGNEQSDNKVAIVIIMRICIAARFKNINFKLTTLIDPNLCTCRKNQIRCRSFSICAIFLDPCG